MDYVIEAEVSPDGRLTAYELPPGIPTGRVKLVIQPVTSETQEHSHLTRAEARRRLLAVGKLITSPVAPEGAVELSDEERPHLATLFGDNPITTLDIINWDRGPRE